MARRSKGALPPAGTWPDAVAPRQVRLFGHGFWGEAPGAGAGLQLDDVEGILHFQAGVDAYTAPQFKVLGFRVDAYTTPLFEKLE